MTSDAAFTDTPAPSLDAFGGWPGTLGVVAGGGDLDAANAEAAMARILAGEATPAQIAGLIVALRVKGESTDEMIGLVRGMLAASTPLTVPADAVDIVGTGGSPHRRKHALNVSTMACFVAAGAGATICKHGNFKASSTSGSFDFLEALGVQFDVEPAKLAQQVADHGIGFALARTYHPSMRHAGPVRAELGIPTVFNVLGPLAHPGRVRRQVVGCATEELGQRMATVLAALGATNTWVVTGDGGLDEFSTTGPSVVHTVVDGAVERMEVDPVDLGMASPSSMDELAGGDAAANVKIFEAILDGSDTGPRADIVVLNAAAGLVVAGVVDGLAAGVDAARAAIDDGRVAAKLASIQRG